MSKQLSKPKGILFSALFLALAAAIAFFLYTRNRPEETSDYDADIIGQWQINSVTGVGDIPEEYSKPEHVVKLEVSDNHTGYMSYGDRKMLFTWKFGERYEDGSLAYVFEFSGMRQVGAILASVDSTEFPESQNLLCVNLQGQTMLYFEKQEKAAGNTNRGDAV